MAFRPAPTPPNLDRLKAVLLSSGLQTKDNNLYQVITQLIDATKFIQTSIESLTVSDATIAPHALLDGLNNNDTVAQGPTRGSIIYGNATPKWDELPIGASGRVLASDGTDVFWSPLPSPVAPGGSDTQVQFNDGGVFGGDAGLVFNKTTNKLTITGNIEFAALDGTFVFNTGNSGSALCRPNSADGSDAAIFQFAGGGAAAESRGAYFTMFGNEHAGAGGLYFQLGNVANAAFRLRRSDTFDAIAVDGATGVTTFGFQVQGITGLAGVPTYASSSDPNTGIYFNGSDKILFSTGGTFRAILGAEGLGLGSATFGTSATNTLLLFNGTVPSTSPADSIQIFSVDVGASRASLGLRLEETVVDNGGGVTSNRQIEIKVNGTTYKLLLST